ncbi:hypothetical protein, partial [Flammeovirga yaeyamensis]
KKDHKDELDSIIMSFTEKFNEEWKNRFEKDEMPQFIMGFDIWRHFGKTKGEITNRNEYLFKDIKGVNQISITLVDFEKKILFKNYLENRIYASDYWL